MNDLSYDYRDDSSALLCRFGVVNRKWWVLDRFGGGSFSETEETSRFTMFTSRVFSAGPCKTCYYHYYDYGLMRACFSVRWGVRKVWTICRSVLNCEFRIDRTIYYFTPWKGDEWYEVILVLVVLANCSQSYKQEGWKKTNNVCPFNRKRTWEELLACPHLLPFLAASEVQPFQ